MNRIFLIAGLLAVAALVALLWHRLAGRTGGPNRGPTVTCQDLVGRKVVVPRDVRRIVLLRSKDIYLLAALLGDELPDRLVGWGPDLARDDGEVYQRFVARFPHLRDLAITGEPLGDGLNVEQLLQLKPDLVISDRYLRDKGRTYSEQMESAGLPVVYLDGSSDPLTGAQKGLKLLGPLLGRAQRATEICDFINGQMEQVTARIAASRPDAPSVYLEAGILGPGTYGQTYGLWAGTGQNTSWGTILQALKVCNIAEGRVVGMSAINPEALLAANPDLIVITGQNWARTDNTGGMQLGFNITPDRARRLLEGFTARPGWDQLAAVRNRRVVSVFHNTVSPTVFSAIQALARACYPALFADLDPQAGLREFYRRFMPIELDGTWACEVGR